MCICFFNIHITEKRFLGGILGIVFLVLSLLAYVTKLKRSEISFIFGLLGCISVLLIIAGSEKKLSRIEFLDYVSQYTMPIFLMHTLFSASLRILLLKIGIVEPKIHILLGISISFMGPICAMWVLKKMNLDFLVYPSILRGRININSE